MDNKAKTLLQYWLISYLSHYLESSFEKDTAPQIVANEYKNELVKLLNSNEFDRDDFTDQDFIDLVHAKLCEQVLRETENSIEADRGDSLVRLLGHLQWLVSSKVEHKFLGVAYKIPDLFNAIGLLNQDVREYLLPNQNISIAQLPKLEVLITKRNIIEYILNKIFSKKHTGDYFEISMPSLESFKINLDTLVEENINILLTFSKTLNFTEVKGADELKTWHKRFSDSLGACLLNLKEARDREWLTWVKDLATFAWRRLWGQKSEKPSTSSMLALEWVKEKFLDLPDGKTVLENHNVSGIIQKCYNSLTLMPDSIIVHKLTLPAPTGSTRGPAVTMLKKAVADAGRKEELTVGGVLVTPTDDMNSDCNDQNSTLYTGVQSRNPVKFGT